MSEIKSFGGTEEPSPLQRALANEPLLPCGHTQSQALWLGCTDTECRPLDTKISAAYWLEKSRERK